jgi:hypothetical protein
MDPTADEAVLGDLNFELSLLLARLAVHHLNHSARPKELKLTYLCVM